MCNVTESLSCTSPSQLLPCTDPLSCCHAPHPLISPCPQVQLHLRRAWSLLQGRLHPKAKLVVPPHVLEAMDDAIACLPFQATNAQARGVDCQCLITGDEGDAWMALVKRSPSRSLAPRMNVTLMHPLSRLSPAPRHI